ncbi:MAG TPA: DUF4349 domain-containing protein [Tenuifilaceae bacterium]|nr:DUF4349 domain-containing protein [Tenuifilaceae bacterium]HPN20482.1 DUF4349 domain-containing protein [Tenuifilaceae bacterium]
MKKPILLTSIALIAILFGCNSKSNSNKAEEQIVFNDAIDMEAAPVATRQDYKADKAGFRNESNEVAPKIIKTANVSMEVVDYAKSKKQIDSIIVASKAYITSEGFQQSDLQLGNNMEIKVPATGFNGLLKLLTTVAKRVDYQNIYTQDVTEEYIDVKTRMENKRKVEKTYLDLLRKTSNIEDILKIENKLGEIRAEIESAEGRMKYIDHQVNLSTISLYFYQKLEFKYTPDEMPSFWQKVKEALHAGWKGIVWVLIFFMKIWPVWVITAVVYLIWWKTMGQKSKKSDKKKKKDKKKKTKDDSNQTFTQESI